MNAFEDFVARTLRPRLAAKPGFNTIDPALLDGLAATGALAAMVAEEHGGHPVGIARYGEMCRVLGAASAAVQSLLTVHGMVCLALGRSGSASLRAELLPQLADGRLLGAFALTEEGAGSDIRAIATIAVPDGADFLVTGVKRWLSFGQLAGVFLTFARVNSGADIALVVRRDDPGVRVVPATATSGFADAMLADLHLEEARIPATRVIGRPGFALNQIATRALTLGRLCVAHGAVGLAEEARDLALEHVTSRRRNGAMLMDFQLVKAMIADVAVYVEAARLLCERAGRSLENAEQWSGYHVLLAKQAAARAASRSAGTCAQLYGARALGLDHPADRLVADARVMEIIEGSTQVVQVLIADQLLTRLRADRTNIGTGGTP